MSQATRPALAAIILTAYITIAAGCGATDDTGQPSPSPAASLNYAAAESAAGIPPEPDAAARRAYLEALRAIDPAIVGTKEDRAVTRGRDQCSSIAGAAVDHAKLVALTNQRFTAPDHPDGFGTAAAERILTAVHTHLCPAYAMP